MWNYLSVAKGFANPTTVGSKEVVSHVGVEVEILLFGHKVSCSCSHLELLVIPVQVCVRETHLVA